MLKRAREVEVNEAALTGLVGLLLVALGFMFYVGARVGGDVARRSAGPTSTAVQVGIGVQRPPLPYGFIGPPGPPNPPPVNGVPGGQNASHLFAVEVAAVADETEANLWKRRLLERSFPAYVTSDPLSREIRTFRVRIGDYATRSEADTVARMVGKRDGFVGTIITPHAR